MRRHATRASAFLAAAAAGATCAGCGQLGLSDRVVGRAVSPDGRVTAVCQEVPAFDGPGYSVRLETRDGVPVGAAAAFGDADPCSEMAWAPDGRMLAVLTAHVARVRFVDVQPQRAAGFANWRQVDLGPEAAPRRGRGLRFIDSSTIELVVCEPSAPGAGCATDEARVRVQVPGQKASAG